MKENEKALNKTGWQTEIIGKDALVQTLTIDPRILSLMPKTAEIFVSRGFFKVASYELRKMLYDIEITFKGGITTTPPPKI